eukprot:scaffold145165_cov54-Attheya_sp.AAC.1
MTMTMTLNAFGTCRSLSDATQRDVMDEFEAKRPSYVHRTVAQGSFIPRFFVSAFRHEQRLPWWTVD